MKSISNQFCIFKGDITYKLEWFLEMWTDDDYYNDYEPYGKLVVDIGARKDNQNITLWKVSRDALVVPLGKVKKFSGTHIFRESQRFRSNGMFTLEGAVMEADVASDIRTDDVIGSYDGETFTVAELKRGKRFPGDRSYAKITMKVIGKYKYYSH